MSRFALTTCVAGLFVCLISGMVAAGTVDDAWAELHKLNTGVAKELFTKAIKENPKDESAKRGLFLAADLDMDHLTASEAVKQMGSQPGDPYLPSVFEYWTAIEKEWSDHEVVVRRIVSMIEKSPHSGHRYMAERMNQSLALATSFKPVTRGTNDGFIGAWAIGPFDNKSDIAFFRDLPLETAPFDTAATATGAMGVRTGWCWLETGADGHVVPIFPFSSAVSNVCLVKAFFELPAEQEIIILLGGVYSSRVRLDGKLIQADPTFRNASIRSGFRARLAQGVHELTLTLGNADSNADVRIGVRGADYTPVAGLRWLRNAVIPANPDLQVSQFHPIFDLFDSLTADRPSTERRFWSGVLRMNNGYTNEAVTEFEAALAENQLTPLEMYLLCQMVEQQGNDVRRGEVLGMISAAACPMVGMQWVRSSAGTTAEQVEMMTKLNMQYPNRVPIEALVNIGYILKGDMQGYKQGILDLMKKYPEAAMLHLVLQQLYNAVNRDYVSAQKEFYEYCRKTSQGYQYLSSLPQHYFSLQKYPEAIAALRDMLKITPTYGNIYDMMVDAAIEAHTPEVLLPDLLALIRQYPYRTIAYDQLYRLYRQMGEEGKAREALLKIHEIKSSAPTPYMRLEELHNNVALDSLFGTINVDSLWQYTPTTEQLGGKNQWMLLDRIQKLVYDKGPTCRDMHSVRVLLDNDAVQAYQEINNPVDESSTFEYLLGARRLRKGQPPLNGEKNEGSILFKDLRPGDAIELRYRQWFNSTGDLWNEFTDNYECYYSLFQRYWEYRILTDRTDIVTTSLPPAPQPTVDTYCGFKRCAWSGDQAEAYQLDLDMLPPSGDVVGRIVVSTIPNWQKLNAWYYSVSEAILNDNPRAKEKAHALTSGLTDSREKARALFRFVSIDIPYQTIDFNYDAAIPQKPDEVLVRRWGDCKDKAHLFISMAREVGIPAWPVLVLTRSNVTSMALPQFDFNHLIAACELEGDTQYVDLTASYYPFEQTITPYTAGQPCLPVSASTNAELLRLPALQTEAAFLADTMEIWIADQAASRFETRRIYRDQRSGSRRTSMYGETPETAREKMQTAAADAWKVGMTIDSIYMDPRESAEPVYHESWWGNMTLTQQHVSNMTLLNLPAWSPFSDGLFTSLYWNGNRQFPVDLRWNVRNTILCFRLHVPASLGAPKVDKPVTIDSEKWQFAYKVSWDKGSSVLTIDYRLIIHDGLVDVESFAKFARTVKEVFDRPVIFDGK